MNRRHFLDHLVGASKLAVPAITLAGTMQAHARQLSRDRRAAILLWMGGGPSTIDLWDMKPGAVTGGPFQPIKTSGEAEICEHLPMLAQQMHHLSIVRSMNTREADHTRGTYYMHTGFVPNADVKHPSYGSLVAHELMDTRNELEIPPFVAVGGGSEGPGFLGMTWAPFVVNANGQVNNIQMGVNQDRLTQRMAALGQMEKSFVRQRRGRAAEDHAVVLEKTLQTMTSDQLTAFDVASEPEAIRTRYGTDRFGQGCLLARRLVEAGVPFVEVDFGGWDHHQNIFSTLETKLPSLDRGFSALVEDLASRGLLESTAIIWMGEFGRTPSINANTGRDHWARAWSVVVGGAGFEGGRVIGSTSDDGTLVTSEPYSSQDLMASVCHALGISLQTSFRTRSGRPMKIANGGKVIEPLFA